MMSVWAIADLHLSFGVPEKTMEIFGPEWLGYAEKLKSNWESMVQPEDLVLIAGDISWAMRLDEAQVDLNWIAELPGTKVMIRGNHDYWWSSFAKVKAILPPSIHIIQNNAFQWNQYSIGGARLWDTDEYDFQPYITWRESPISSAEQAVSNREKIFQREMHRLELSLNELDQNATKRIVMTHYPPISAELLPSTASALLERYHVDVCVFGHLHSVKKECILFGTHNAVHYYLTSCDYLEFKPLKIPV